MNCWLQEEERHLISVLLDKHAQFLLLLRSNGLPVQIKAFTLEDLHGQDDPGVLQVWDVQVTSRVAGQADVQNSAGSDSSVLQRETFHANVFYPTSTTWPVSWPKMSESTTFKCLVSEFDFFLMNYYWKNITGKNLSMTFGLICSSSRT